MRLQAVTYLCRDYDEAIGWFTDALGWLVTADQPMGTAKRWVVVSPSAGGSGLRLAKAASPQQLMQVGSAAAGLVGFIAYTDNFRVEQERMEAAGVRFLEEPRNEPYGLVAVFEDLYGNRWDLIEPR